MKVFELMAELADLTANADIQLCCNDPEVFGVALGVSFDGKKSKDAFVNISFEKSLDCD